MYGGSVAPLHQQILRTTNWFLLLGLSLFGGAQVPRDDHDAPATFYTNDFVIRVSKPDSLLLQLVLTSYGFQTVRQLSEFDSGYYWIRHDKVCGRCRRQAVEYTGMLEKDPRIIWVEQQISLHRQKRVLQRNEGVSNVQQGGRSAESVPELEIRDPLFGDQWYLHQGAVASLNVWPVWSAGYTGRDVVVTVIDDGLEHNHPDIVDNYLSEASYDYNGEGDASSADNDPQPVYRDNVDNSHGTQCAGVIAASSNNICGIGIAYNAKIGGVRLLDGMVTDVLEAQSLVHQDQLVDVYSSSWGPADDGVTVGGPGQLATLALETGVTRGRSNGHGGNGPPRGNIYVWASGNGGAAQDDCNLDGYAASRFTISVAAADSSGWPTRYGERCSSIMTSVYTTRHGTGGNESTAAIVTTGANGECQKNFTGTSSAAPLVAGIIALLLDAHPDLSWRDVQHLLVRASRIPLGQTLKSEDSDTGWSINAAGFHFHPYLGFGVLDATMLLHAASQWEMLNKTKQDECHAAWDSKKFGRGNSSHVSSVQVSCDQTAGDSAHRLYIEHVVAHVSVKSCTAGGRGALHIHLTSPSGTTSQLLSNRPRDVSGEGFHLWPFNSLHFWGEPADGEWRLAVSCPATLTSQPEVTAWTLSVYGTILSSPPPTPHVTSYRNLSDVNSAVLKEIIREEQEVSDRIVLKPKATKPVPPSEYTNMLYTKDVSRTGDEVQIVEMGRQGNARSERVRTNVRTIDPGQRTVHDNLALRTLLTRLSEDSMVQCSDTDMQGGQPQSEECVSMRSVIRLLQEVRKDEVRRMVQRRRRQRMLRRLFTLLNDDNGNVS